MSMKLNNIVERCSEMESKKSPVKKTFRKRRANVMQSIYMLYIIQAITLIALVILWFRVFFLHGK